MVALIRPEDQPGDLVEQRTDGEVPPEMKKYYYDPSKYKTTWISSASSIRRR